MTTCLTIPLSLSCLLYVFQIQSKQQKNNMKVDKDNLKFQPMQESEVEQIFNLINDAYRYGSREDQHTF